MTIINSLVLDCLDDRISRSKNERERATYEQHQQKWKRLISQGFKIRIERIEPIENPDSNDANRPKEPKRPNGTKEPKRPNKVKE